MKKIFNLTKILYKTNKNDSGKITKKKKIILYSILAIYILFVFVNFWNMFITPLKEIGKPEAAITLILSLSTTFIFVTSIMYAVNVLYFSNDIENILPFPFKPKEIFSAKLLTVYLYELAVDGMLLLPGFIAYGMQMNENFIYYIYSFIVFLLVPIVPLAVITIFYTIIMRFLKFAKYKNVFKVITTIILLILIIAFEMNLNANMTENGDYSAEYILSMSEDFNNNLPYHLNSAVDAICSSKDFSGFISMVWFIIINLAVVLIVVELFSKSYMKGIYYNLGTISVRSKRNSQNSEKGRPLIISLIDKDIKNLFRSSTYFVQCVLPAFLMPIIFLLMSSGAADGTFDMEMSGTVRMIFGLVIIQFFMMMNNASVTAISKDGSKEALYVKTLPIRFEKLISAKVVPEILLGIINLVISLILINKLIQLQIVEIIALFIIGILLNVVQSYLFILIDLVHPKLYWESEIAVAKQNMNVFYGILISIAMILVMSLLGYLFIKLDVIYFLLSSVILIMVIYFSLKLYIKKNAEKLYSNVV